MGSSGKGWQASTNSFGPFRRSTAAGEDLVPCFFGGRPVRRGALLPRVALPRGLGLAKGDSRTGALPERRAAGTRAEGPLVTGRYPTVRTSRILANTADGLPGGSY